MRCVAGAQHACDMPCSSSYWIAASVLAAPVLTQMSPAGCSGGGGGGGGAPGGRCGAARGAAGRRAARAGPAPARPGRRRGRGACRSGPSPYMTKFVCCAAASGLPMRSAGAGWQGVRGVWRARGPGPRQEHPADKGFGRARHARACQASPHRLAKLRFRVLGSPQGAAKRRPARGARQVRQARRAAEEAAAAAQARTAAAAEQQRRLERLEAEAADAHAAALRCAPAPGPAQASRAGPRRGRHACCHADAPALLEATASRVDSAHAPALQHAAPRSRGRVLGRRHACV